MWLMKAVHGGVWDIFLFCRVGHRERGRVDRLASGSYGDRFGAARALPRLAFARHRLSMSKNVANVTEYMEGQMQRSKLSLVATITLFLLIGFLSIMAQAQTAEEQEAETIKVTAPGAYRPQKTPSLDRAVTEIVQQTNAFRTANKESKVEVSPKLSEAATEFARYMAQTDRYGHEADGNPPQGRAEKHGYKYCLIAENIAYVFDSAGFSTDRLADQFVNGWKNSPPHRRNMLDSDVVNIGVGVAQSSDTGVFYAVQMFGRPQSMRFEFSVANETERTVAYRLGTTEFTLPPRYVRTHERCRSADLRFATNDDFAPTSTIAEHSFRPKNGSRYTVEAVNSKRFTVEEK